MGERDIKDLQGPFPDLLAAGPAPSLCHSFLKL